MQKIILAGGVVVGPDNKILVVNQHGNSWSLPKGHVEKGETKIQAAKREIYEESGIKINNLKLIFFLGKYQRNKINKSGSGEIKKTPRTIYMYLFKTNQNKLCPIDDENPEARWVAINKVSQFLTHPKDKWFFESIKIKTKI